jgi:hypothetical protein
VEIVDTRLLVHLGHTNVSFSLNVSDKRWHQVEIAMSLDAVQVTLDKCLAKKATIAGYASMLADRQANRNGDDVQLSLGGMLIHISINIQLTNPDSLNTQTTPICSMGSWFQHNFM